MGSSSWFQKFLFKYATGKSAEEPAKTPSAIERLPPLGHILELHHPSSFPKIDLKLPTRTVSWRPRIPVPNHDITHQERDLFRAKSFTLLSQSNLPYPTTQWIELLQETPIFKVAAAEDEPLGKITLQQMLPLTSCRVLIEVSFQRQGNLRIPSVPLKESFHLSIHPNGTHPLPRQHTGFALGENLFIPSKELLAKKSALIQKREVLGDQPQVPVNRKHAFEKAPQELLKKHRMLAFALESASHTPCPMNAIDAYFATLTQKDAWNHLTHLYETINFLVMNEPPSLLLPANPLSGEPLAILAFQRFQNAHPAECYTKWFVEVLRKAVANPETPFGNKLQQLYELQLNLFLQSENSSLKSPDEVALDMLKALTQEIHILQS